MGARSRFRGRGSVLLPVALLVAACAPPAAVVVQASAFPVTTVVTSGRGWGPQGLAGPRDAAGTCHARRAADGLPLPDPRCTPGAVDSAVTQANLGSTVCRPGYASSVRPPLAFTEPAKLASMAAYGAPGPASAYEYDHLVPLELGGSSDLRNLWPELDSGSPSAFDSGTPRGRNAKDGVEDRLHAAVCAGEVPLAAAQRAIAADWTTAEAELGVRP